MICMVQHSLLLCYYFACGCRDIIYLSLGVFLSLNYAKMGRLSCYGQKGLKKRSWTPEENEILVNYINEHGQGNWQSLPKQASSFSLSISFASVMSFVSLSTRSCVRVLNELHFLTLIIWYCKLQTLRKSLPIQSNLYITSHELKTKLYELQMSL